MGFSFKVFIGTALFGLAFSPLGARAESDGNTPASAPSALVVYNDYYVPDAVRAKYDLGNASFDPQTRAQPEQLSPAAPSLPLNPATTEQGVESWRARKGENVRDVLSRWAARQSINVNWDSKKTPDLDKDFSFVGKFEDAVNQLLKETSGNNLQSKMMTSSLQE